MHRILVEMAVTVGASALIAGAVLVAGNSSLKPAPAPPPAYVTQPPGCRDAPILEVRGSGVTGRAKLCILDEGVRSAADVEGLTPGTTYTTWIAYFDRPLECQKPHCALDDLRGTAMGVAGRMDGIAADGFRRAQFNGDLRDLKLAGRSEVWLLVFDRGPTIASDGQLRASQLLSASSPLLRVPTVGDATGDRVVAQAIFSMLSEQTYVEP
ncbi:MAG: hypothetical protein IT305_15800 [Chloroflexi bacterium]|nr:hypothetical protein [Chloroflexota bacterium]